jgi:D-alanyl-D-alanine carboxypeptidase
MKPRSFTPALAAAIVAAAMFLSGPAAAGPHLVVDLASGRVLSQQDAFRRWYPASLTKLMTAYVVFRAIQAGEITLASPVTISRNAANEPPSRMGYKPGSVLTVDNALKILMVKSANDVATAVAESVGGSEKGFAARMNAEAARLGMVGSHFVNAHGLHDDDHYTTAHDLALLAVALRKQFPQYASYFSIEAIGTGEKVIENHNNLIGHFDGADGMKTGYTCPAGWNVIASATRNGRTVIAVVIGEVSADDRDVKAASLLAKGLTASGFAAPRLASMQPTGRMLAQATNMRPEICTKEARKRLAAKRNAEGKIVVRSPYLHEMTRPRKVVMIALGDADGPAPAGVVYADVPIPTPRPDYPPHVAEGDD